MSAQGPGRQRLKAWRTALRAAATEHWPPNTPPSEEPLEITIVYYHEGESIRMDNDNMVKPIQDALAGLIYVNDNQITDAHIRKTRLDGAFRVRGMSPALAEAFCRDREFLHIKVTSAPDHTELLQ